MFQDLPVFCLWKRVTSAVIIDIGHAETYFSVSVYGRNNFEQIKYYEVVDEPTNQLPMRYHVCAIVDCIIVYVTIIVTHLSNFLPCCVDCKALLNCSHRDFDLLNNILRNTLFGTIILQVPRLDPILNYTILLNYRYRSPS